MNRAKMGRRPLRPPRFLLRGVIAALVAFPAALTGQQGQRQEEAEDHYRKWLKEDVAYIITEQEREVFLRLSTDEEREQFIEQFWGRRDPDPRTAANEYKQEHYRRIAYANERFSAGFPGWRTDRGKTYIIHGPPDELIDYPSGGTYDRPLHEGGGVTATYPFEIWRYRHIEGAGTNIELQFVDRANSNEYRLALGPEEKDAFLHVPTAGHTAAELLGWATRRERPYFSPGGSYPLMNYREQDSAFQRYERFVNVQRAPTIEYTDLKQIVEVNTSYDALPFECRADYFRLNDSSILVPITVQIDHSQLTFDTAAGGKSGVAIYGLVTGMDRSIAAEFEDELFVFSPSMGVDQGSAGGSLYQKMVILEARGRYKLDVVAKDLNSGKIGVRTLGIRPPKHEGDKLSASSLVLSDYIVPARENGESDEMFVLGDVKVRPKVDQTFSPRSYFAVYTQLHNLGIDQSTRQPDFHINYRILKDGRVRLEESDEQGSSVQYFSPNRMVLIKRLPLTDLPPGRYQVEVEFIDKIRGETLSRSTPFQVADPAE